MTWTEFLNTEIEETYRATLGLVALCDDDALDWKPSTANNWMTQGQLLFHLTEACGKVAEWFVTGNWPQPDGDASDAGLLPAEKMRSIDSVAAAAEAIRADRKVAEAMVAEAGEADLASKSLGAPWNPTPRSLGYQLYTCVVHLASHKSQLFYYLKLQGKPVDTMALWGMAE